MKTHCNAILALFARAWLAAALLFVAADCQAQPVNLSYLDGKDPVAPDAVTTFGPDLFGDRVNVFNGALEFEQTDLSLPGNSALPVALVRHHSPGQAWFVRGQFGDWDLQAPRIGGTFANTAGWVTSFYGVNRCSGFSLPPAAAAASAMSSPQAPMGSGRGSTSPLARGGPARALPDAVVGFDPVEYWRRTSLDIPGQGSQEVLLRSPAYTAAPTDGASYPLVTHNNWQIGCLPSVQNAAGEGFVAVSPEGVRYRFDWMATRMQTDLRKSGATLGRTDYFLMATLVTDRFGNWVRYTYDSANPLLLTRIDASDGRAIVVTNSGGRAAAATDGTRTYSYSYDAQGSLTGVLQPDGSRWSFELTPMVSLELSTMGEYGNCDGPGDFPADALTGTITHPSGAVGRFTTAYRTLGRAQVQRVCDFAPNSNSVTTGAVWPRSVATATLVSKQISGPGMPTMTWNYAYDAPGGWSSCAAGTCPRETRIVTVTNPSGTQTRHVFGSRWRVNEGQLLELDEGWNGSTALKTTTYHYREPAGQAYPEQFGASLLPNSDWLAARHRPQDLRVVTLQSSTFTWQVDPSPAGFDGYVRPLLAQKFSSLGTSRTEVTQYADNTAKWVLGQVAGVTERGTGRVVEAHDYDPVTAMPTADYSFGRRVISYAYNADGTLATVRDAAGHPIQLAQYKRGKPQLVSYPEGSSESQVLNNLGRPDSRTNAAGTTTSYLYDAMGRVAGVTYPAGDAASYFPTNQAFEQVYAAEFGLPPGHWRQTISTGNVRMVRYLDAMWRKRVELVYDAADPAGSTSFVETRYDVEGRKQFEGYAVRDFWTVDAALPGRSTDYDAIGRVVAERADSELGVLQTLTQYPPNVFQRVVTNPRGYATTHAFQAFDAPAMDHLAQVWAPEGVTVSIVRDVFGKPSSITRSGAAASATRSYVYDEFERLCKTVEPESGATIQDYDLAGNVAWRASGLAPGTTSGCDRAGVPAARKVSFAYDALNRLVDTSYGDGAPGIHRSYTPDGLPALVSTSEMRWNYAYNNRRLLTAEMLSWAWQSPGGGWNFLWGIDAYGHVASLTDPWGPMGYDPDALGRPHGVWGYAYGATYHPNGALAGYTLVNGIVHSMTQNVRGLPAVWRDAGVLQYGLSYDADGNVTRLSDDLEGVAGVSMGYDGLDRLTAANGIWGTGAFSYDALDNIRSSTLGARSLQHQIDPATNRVVALSGSLNIALAYDANGNLSQRGGQGYVFDVANRLRSVAGLASYSYDGNDRRHWIQRSDGGQRLSAYDHSGRLRFSWDSARGNTQYIYLGQQLIAERGDGNVVTLVHTDVLGSPVAHTDTAARLLDRTRYEPYGATAAGTIPAGIGFTGHVNDVQTGLVYMQQRYYDPIAGRFLSVDPVTTEAGSGGHFNRYVYANNNPYGYIDPDGRDSCTGSHIPCANGGIAPGFSGRSYNYGGGSPANQASANYLYGDLQHTAGDGPSGRDPYDRHLEGVRSQAELLRSQGFEVLGFEVPASVLGLDYGRRYDIVARDDQGRIFGVEVKTSLTGIFRLDPKQVEFDALAVEKGAVSATTPIIRGVMYRGECFGCGPDAIYRSWKLMDRLTEKGVSFYPSKPPQP